jgi:hypothetical protein
MYYLRDILKRTNTEITPTDCSLPEFLNTIGQNCFGSIGMATSMMEQIICSEITTKKQVLELFAIPDVQVVQKALIDILNGKNSDAVFSLLEIEKQDQLENTFGLIYKLIGDGEMFKVLGKINDKRDLFIKQAAMLGGHPCFPILRNAFQTLSRLSSPYLKKPDFILTVTKTLSECINYHVQKNEAQNVIPAISVRKAIRREVETQ